MSEFSKKNERALSIDYIGPDSLNSHLGCVGIALDA